MTIDDASKIRGAVYIPARAFNAYQMWRDYDRAIIERDLTYASRLSLNALRVFLSYEYFLENRGRLENSLYHLAHSAWGHKIRILPVLFECCGVEPTEESRNDRNPATAVCVRSPHSHVINDPPKWHAIEDFVNWFMQRWAHEHRMLALEVINEPGTVNEFKFALAMFIRAARMRRSLPVTFGALRLEDSRLLQDLGLDILQFHENEQRSEDDLRASLRFACETQEILGRPVLLTQWQPPYAIAPLIQSCGLGSFFWSLMVRPPYLQSQGTLSGVFHESGAVWSLDDARAISQNPNFTAEQRRERPVSAQ